MIFVINKMRFRKNSQQMMKLTKSKVKPL